ncbi:MAG: lactate utilization protein [Kiritimatiellae bacterium]|nr:lactate utilization protein [Kiritimatiellia bacterium]
MEQSAVDTLLAWQSAARLNYTAEKLRKRGFDVEVCATREIARERLLTFAETAHTIGFGGSLSVACLNLTHTLRDTGKEILNHGFPNLTPEERDDIRRRQLSCDLFLSSVNAMTDEGVIVNVDGVGNRVAAMIYGPRQIVLVVGRNKLVKGDEADALKRIAETAAPVNAYRLGCKTPCAVTGRCASCAGVNEGSICRVTTIIHQRPLYSNVTILLVDEDLGL